VNSYEDLPVQRELQDIFLKPDGSRMQTAQEWPQQRTYWLRQLMYYKYGTVPSIDSVTVREFSVGSETNSVSGLERREEWSLRTIPGTEGRTVQIKVERKTATAAEGATSRSISCDVSMFRAPGTNLPLPVLIVCWPPSPKQNGYEVISTVCNRGYLYVGYDSGPFCVGKNKNEGLKALFPETEYDCGDYAARGWSYSAIIDYLLSTGLVDPKRIAVMGFSKCGASSLIAGILDERIALVMTGGSNVGGTQPIRKSDGIKPLGKDWPYWHWVNNRYRELCLEHTERLPIDSHVAVALCAPRCLIMSEGTSDRYVGTQQVQQSYMAAQEIYRFLGNANRLGYVTHNGGHQPDWNAFIEFMDVQFKDESPKRDYWSLPYPDVRPIFKWTGPDKEKTDEKIDRSEVSKDTQ
jgi:endo-1,4-beta-xylanase